MTDYYSILGVTKTSSQDEIKQAYRRLAMKYHPDRTGGDDTKFKEIQSAYDTLGDPDKRQQYDTGGQPQFRNFNGGFGHPDINEIFKNFGFQFGGDPFGAFRQPRRNQDLRISIAANLAETLEEITKTVSIEFSKGGRQTVEIKIPRGITNGSTVKYPGLGDNFFDTLPQGDLYVDIILQPQDGYTVHGTNVVTELEVDCLTAIVGGEFTVSNFDGKQYNLTLPPGTQHGQGFRIKDQGLWDINSSTRGSLIVKINIIIPTNLNSQQLDLIQQIKQHQ